MLLSQLEFILRCAKHLCAAKTRERTYSGPVQPLVSVIVLCFNSAQVAIEAAKSALESTYTEIELIFVDDGSADDSVDVLQGFISKFKGTLVRNERNLGIPASCNVGLEKCSGDYVIVIGDDLLLADRVAADVNILEESNLAACCSQAGFIDEKGNELDIEPEPRGLKTGVFTESSRRIWLDGSKIFTPTATYRKTSLELIGGWPTGFMIEDKPLFLRFAQEGYRIHARAEKTTMYRRHGGNFSSKFRKEMFLEELQMLNDFNIALTNLEVTFKQLKDMHYWHLFMGVSREVLLDSCRGLHNERFLQWTLRSMLVRGAVALIASLYRRGYRPANLKQYLSK